MNFQELIFTLDRYWAKHGCAVRPGGAAPALSGVRPVSLAGAVRLPSLPGYAYQVLLRPAPPEARRLFLGAVKLAGIDRSEHDLRWVEAGRGLLPRGVQCLGWEVLLDGLHLARFIYLQEDGAAGAAWLELSLERLALASQRKRTVSGLSWADGLTYGMLHDGEKR